MEEGRARIAGGRRDVAFDRRRVALSDADGELPPLVELVRRDPCGEIPSKRLRTGRRAEQRQRGVVGREHRPVRAQPQQAAGLDVQQAAQVRNFNRRLKFRVVHGSPPAEPPKRRGPDPWHAATPASVPAGVRLPHYLSASDRRHTSVFVLTTRSRRLPDTQGPAGRRCSANVGTKESWRRATEPKPRRVAPARTRAGTRTAQRERARSICG